MIFQYNLKSTFFSCSDRQPGRVGHVERGERGHREGERGAGAGRRGHRPRGPRHGPPRGGTGTIKGLGGEGGRLKGHTTDFFYFTLGKL